MLERNEQLKIYDLLNTGWSVKEIAKRTGKSLGTIYRYKGLGGQLQGRTADGYKIPTSLGPYQELIDYHIKKRKLRPANIFTILQQEGYRGSFALFERCYKHRCQAIKPNRSLKRFETEKGEQGQVDWAHFGKLTINGKLEKIYLFAYILSWSRMIYLEFVVRQNQRTLQICHIHAFNKLGIPKTILYDNMKTVVSHNRKRQGAEVVYNSDFKDFARYYQFEPEACSPSRPHTKGKIEAAINYTRKYFARLSPRLSLSLEDINRPLLEWTEEANHRLHETIKEVPYERWLEERDVLGTSSNLPPYTTTPLETHKSTPYGLLIRKGVTYDLTPKYAQLVLEAREIQEHGLPKLQIYLQNKILATLEIPSKLPGWVSVFPNIIEELQAEKNIAEESYRKKRKKIYSYDIEVEDRDLKHYSLDFLPIEKAKNG